MSKVRDFAAAKRFVTLLNANGEFNEATLFGFAKQRKYEETVAALAALSQSTVSRVPAGLAPVTEQIRTVRNSRSVAITATHQISASLFNVARKLRLRFPTRVVPNTSAWSSSKVPENPLVTSCPAKSGRTKRSGKDVC
jgi:hypothetical protein